MKKCVRRLYLIRHGRVEFPEGVRRCIGRTELPLSAAGQRQGKDLGDYFTRHPITKVFASPLERCQETAELLGKGVHPVQTVAGLQELDMGEWENVPMNQLHKELESEPELGEGRETGLKRFREAVREILCQSEGDVAVVAHGGVNCCFLSEILGTPLAVSRALPQPCGGISVIEAHPDGRLQAVKLGVMPKKAPSPEECKEIWEHYHTPEWVREHCKAVREAAEELGRELMGAGHRLDMELLESGALLHDVAREKPCHDREGAHIVRREGYPQLARMIGKHHDLQAEVKAYPGDDRENGQTGYGPDEIQVLYLADKLVQGVRRVSLEERFAASRERCQKMPDSESALAACERRYREAMEVERKIRVYRSGRY